MLTAWLVILSDMNEPQRVCFWIMQPWRPPFAKLTPQSQVQCHLGDSELMVCDDAYLLSGTRSAAKLRNGYCCIV